ncbi:MAG: lipopolysaccharide kinase InaA family protein [Planctomycetaceae bacterium]
MKNSEFEAWDDGRLVVNQDFAATLRRNGLITFDSVMQHRGETVAKNLLRERVTTRFTLRNEDGSEDAFYIKRHSPPPWKEYIKPLLRLTSPMLGARHEWEAILQFHRAGIPTMTPVALGESGGHSFLITHALEGCTKLSHWLQPAHGTIGVHFGADAKPAAPGRSDRRSSAEKRGIIRKLGQIARTMHSSGMHHQDFYLTHFLRPNDVDDDRLYVIDLGRVRRRKLLAKRWIVKDLAQLNYSSPQVTKADRLRFLETYLGRPLNRADRPLLWQIERKTHAIRRHSARHQL